jgi:hypothetical protein
VILITSKNILLFHQFYSFYQEFEMLALNKSSLSPLTLAAVVAATTVGSSLLFSDTASAAAIRPVSFATNVLPRNDDGSTGQVPISFTLNFFGVTDNDLYVNNNGNVTFTGPLSTFTPFGLAGVGTQIIAPFFADVDTRNTASAEVTYGAGTIDGRNAFVVNWVNVGYFSFGADKLNSFQLVLIDRSDVGAGDFDFEFNYDQIQWETGGASGGSGGFGGTSAAVGYSNGIVGAGNVSLDFPGSRVPGSFLDGGPRALISGSLNSNVLGRYNFFVRNGAVLPPQPEPIGTPEPATVLGLVAVGLVGITSRLKKEQGK